MQTTYKPNLKVASDRLVALEARLHTEYPGTKETAEHLARTVVECGSSDLQDLWRLLWQKPLFANTRQGTGQAWISQLKPFMANAWQSWGTAQGELFIERIGKNSSNDSYIVQGPLASRIGKGQEITISLDRLYRVQGAAKAFRARVAKNPKFPFADLASQDLENLIPMLKDELGQGWGRITILHFLTDLGLACKPDIHLVRTVRCLGLIDDLSFQGVPSDRDALVINRRVKAMCQYINSTVSGRDFRYLDKTLMDISERGLLRGAPC